MTGFQRDILSVIAGLDDPHGLAVKTELDEDYESEINHDRRYPTLDTLVEKGQIDDHTNSYSLTQRSRREIDARREWDAKFLGDGVAA